MQMIPELPSQRALVTMVIRPRSLKINFFGFKLLAGQPSAPAAIVEFNEFNEFLEARDGQSAEGGRSLALIINVETVPRRECHAR